MRLPDEAEMKNQQENREKISVDWNWIFNVNEAEKTLFTFSVQTILLMLLMSTKMIAMGTPNSKGQVKWTFSTWKFLGQTCFHENYCALALNRICAFLLKKVSWKRCPVHKPHGAKKKKIEKKRKKPINTPVEFCRRKQLSSWWCPNAIVQVYKLEKNISFLQKPRRPPKWQRKRKVNLCGRELQVWSDAAQRHFSKTVWTTSQWSGGHFSISEPRRRLKKDYRLSPGCAMTWFRGEEVNQTAMLELEISGTHLASQKPLATIRAAEKSDCAAAQILNVPQSPPTPRRLNISLRMHVAGSADLWESIYINMVCYSSKCMQQTSFKKRTNCTRAQRCSSAGSAVGAARHP